MNNYVLLFIIDLTRHFLQTEVGTCLFFIFFTLILNTSTKKGTVGGL